MRIGTDAHKELFCRRYLESHCAYEPDQLRWPELNDDFTAVLHAAAPALSQALQDEQTGADFLTRCADATVDPRIREALALQSFEEERHKRILEHMISRYGLTVADVEPRSMPADAPSGLVWFGHVEYADCFTGYGFVALVARSGLVPSEFVKVFDRILDEETQHTAFFANWLAYITERSPRWSRATISLRGYRAVLERLAGLGLSAKAGARERVGYAPISMQQVVGDITASDFLETCLAEHERRTDSLDPELLRPQLLPRLARGGLPLVRAVERATAPFYS